MQVAMCAVSVEVILQTLNQPLYNEVRFNSLTVAAACYS